ncbi:MAG: Na/Pi symporter, partial [Clostridia bacterium]|nr:Na/Pi symporter [Clostridia bacterium]
MTIFNLISMIGGLTFFLYGMNVMSSSLEKMAGGKLEEMLRKMTSNPLMSLTLGAVITIAVQSSSAVTVMLVGLVNSGIMSFTQTVHVVFGSNIGTTLTAWLTSLAGIESSSFWMQMLKPINFSPILAFIGIGFIMLSKNDKKKTLGTIFVGFAILMFGMDVMSDAVSPLA